MNDSAQDRNHIIPGTAFGAPSSASAAVSATVSPTVSTDSAVLSPSLAQSASRAVSGPETAKVYLVQLDPYTSNQGQTLALAEALNRKNWDTSIICREHAPLREKARARGLRVYTVPDEGTTGVRMVWGLLRAIKGNGKTPFLLHACDPDASALVSQAWRMNKKLRIVHTRRVPVMESSFKAMKPYTRPPVDVITDSLAGKIALQLSGLGMQKLHTIACGIDPEAYPTRQERRDKRFLHAVLGEMATGSGHGIVYDAMVDLESYKPLLPWEVRFFGRGPALPGMLEEAQEKGIDKRLVMLSEADEVEQLCMCDSLILPSTVGESYLPLILLGWACHVPIITVNRLDHAETLVDGLNCLLVQPGDHAALAAHMAAVSRDPDLRRRLVTNGCNALQKFSLDTMVDAHISLYRNVLV